MVPRLIFADAGAFIARYRTSDDHHAAATAAWGEIERRKTPCLTTSLVLVEAARFLAFAVGNARTAERVRLWLTFDRLTIARPDREIELEAADLLETYADQRIDFVDCISFVTMRRRGVDTVFGFDRHFRHAGFKLWPPGRPS